MYQSQTFKKLTQSALVNDFKRVLAKNKGGEAQLKEQMLSISQNNQKIFDIKVYQPVAKSQQTISESRR